jgi:copper(I)-binding protein
MNRNIVLVFAACVSALAMTTRFGPAGPSRVFAQGAVTVRDAWIREPLGDRNVTAAFAVVENSGAANRAIVSAAAEVADKVELHEMKMVDSMMRMSPVKQIEVPAGGRVELKPGGLHVMLFGLKRMPKGGETIGLTLTLDDATTVSVTAAVRKQEGMK